MNPQDVSGRAREVLQNLPPQLEDARENLAQINTRALSFIRQNPGLCLLGAVAVGFVVGKIAARD